MKDIEITQLREDNRVMVKQFHQKRDPKGHQSSHVRLLCLHNDTYVIMKTHLNQFWYTVCNIFCKINRLGRFDT